jgi:general secretion pathway protein H
VQNEKLKKFIICNLKFSFSNYPSSNPSHFRGKGRGAGFTLIEIIIVLLIIGIASGLVGILVSKGSGKLEIRTFTKDISAVLRYARSQAVSEKKIYCFVIDRKEQMYRLYAEDTDHKNTEIVMSKSVPEELLMTLQDSDEDSPRIEFSPRGNSTGGVIEITDEKGITFFIQINRITGRVEVERAE